MAYGTIKVDNITFTTAGADAFTTVSGIYRAITSGVTVSGTISGNTIQGATISGTTSIFGSGTVTSPSVSIGTGTTYAPGIYSPGTDQLAISTNGSQRLLIDSTGALNLYQNSAAGYVYQALTNAASNGYAKQIFNIGASGANGTAEINYAPGVFFALGPVANDTTTPIVFRNNNATERLRIDSSGRLLVGTSSSRSVATQQSVVQVEGTSFSTTGFSSCRNSNDVYGSYLHFGKTRGSTVGSNTIVSSGDDLGGLIFGGADGTDVDNQAAYILCQVDGTPGVNDMPGRLVFWTTPDGAASPTERMRIDSSGRVGIGTTSPGAKAEIVSSGSESSLILRNTNSTPSTYSELKFAPFTGTTAAAASIRSEYYGNNSSSLAFRTTNIASEPATRMFIGDAGNVGIGTTSPGAPLHIGGTTAGAVQAILTNGVSDPNFQLWVSNGASGLANDTIQASIRLAYSGVGFGPGISFTRGSSTYNGALLLETSGAEKARIDSSGRLLVGTSSTSATCNALLQTNGGTAGTLILAYGNTSPASGQDLGFISFNDSSHIYNSAIIRAARDGGTWTSGTSMPTRLTFSTTDDGASSPTERMRITSGGYIKASNTGVYTDAGGGSRATNYQHFFRSDQNGLTIQATNTNLGSGVEGFTSDFATGATGTHFIGAINLVRTFIVYANGNVANTNNSYGAISDIKLKENIVDAKSQWNDLKALQVRNYNLKKGQTHTQIGLIAQEVELVSPGLVNESPDLDKDGVELGTVTKRVNYSVLYMKAVKALQEAMERIETLEAKVAALESA